MTAYSVSIIIPCRNERGNIEQAITRLPMFGKAQEIIFVEGHSRDGTLEELYYVTWKYKAKGIKWLVQDGAGKGDAVRRGFDYATGDILMILDADLTMPPEELPKFYDALATGKGRFVNGNRMAYPMEHGAMQWLNLWANKFFAKAFTWILGQPIQDTLCGTKALFRSDYERIAKQRAYFGTLDPFGDFDLLFGAARLGLPIVEVPIQYKRRTYGRTNIKRFSHGWLLFKMMLRGIWKLKVRG